MKQGLEFWVNKDIRVRGYRVTIFSNDLNSKGVARPLTFVKVDEDTIIREDTLTLHFEEASALMDELWKAGVRPTDVGTPGELGAVKYHLEDMRKLVFDSQYIKR